MDLALRVTGLVASLILTLAAYFLVLNPAQFHLENRTAAVVILMFAMIQSIAQLLCFINLWKEKGPLWNLYVFLSTVSIIFIIVFFSLWIMHQLDYNMMPSPEDLKKMGLCSNFYFL